MSIHALPGSTFVTLLEDAANVDPDGYRVWLDEMASTLAPQPVTEFVALLSSIGQKLTEISERTACLPHLAAKVDEYEPLIALVRERAEGRGAWGGLFSKKEAKT